MENKKIPAYYARLRIVMKRSFEEFSNEERNKFLIRFSEITGCPEGEIRDIIFRRGCVVFEGTVLATIARRIIELFKSHEHPDSVESKDVKDFMQNEHVTNISADFNISWRIVIKAHPSYQHLVFVHGWRGDNNSFGKFPKYLETRFNCTSEVFPYSTGLWKHSPSLQAIAQSLDNWLRNHVDSPRIGVIAHSMGGLIVRRFLCNQISRRDRLDHRIKQLTFLASPQNGSVLASLLSNIPFWKRAQLIDLSPNSSFLLSLATDWPAWVTETAQSPYRVRSIYGTKDSIVAATNAMGLDRQAVPIIGETHRSLVKPKASNSEVVLTVSRFLKDAGFNV